MISTDMRYYDYFTLGEDNAYGQPTLSTEPVGRIKMTINITDQSIQENINYSNCNYVGLTTEQLTDKYVIQYGEEKLKVKYINPKGRYKTVFMVRL